MAAKKRKRLIWVTLTIVVLASAAVVSLKAIGSKPAKIDPEKTGEGRAHGSCAIRRRDRKSSAGHPG